MIKIKISNVDEVEKFLITLPKKIDKELTYANTSLMSNIYKSARRRAPVDTDSLRESIQLPPVKKGKTTKKWQLVVNSPYALFQEEGFTPHSFYASGAFNSSKLSPGRRYFVSKWTPFVKPAFNEQIKSFSDKLKNAMGRAIKK